MAQMGRAMATKKPTTKMRVLRGGRKPVPPQPPPTPSEPDDTPRWSLCFSVLVSGKAVRGWDHKEIATDEPKTARAAVNYPSRVARVLFRGVPFEVQLHSLRAIDKAEFDRAEQQRRNEIGRAMQQIEFNGKLAMSAMRLSEPKHDPLD
jgi:hypothetical protein